MRIRLTKKPGQPGTKGEVQTYGERLVCVRYRYDQARGKRYKTVELIVETVDWSPRPAPAPAPRPPRPVPSRAPRPVPPETPVLVRAPHHTDPRLTDAIRSLSGVWDARRKLWWMRYDAAVSLGLEDRIAWDALPKSGRNER